MWSAVLFTLLILVILTVAIYLLGKFEAYKKRFFPFMYWDLTTIETFELGLTIIKREIRKIDWEYERNKFKIQLVYLLAKWKSVFVYYSKRVRKIVVDWFKKVFGRI